MLYERPIAILFISVPYSLAKETIDACLWAAARCTMARAEQACTHDYWALRTSALSFALGRTCTSIL